MAARKTNMLQTETDNDNNNSSLNLLQVDAHPDVQLTVSKHWRQIMLLDAIVKFITCVIPKMIILLQTANTKTSQH